MPIGTLSQPNISAFGSMMLAEHTTLPTQEVEEADVKQSLIAALPDISAPQSTFILSTTGCRL